MVLVSGIFSLQKFIELFYIFSIKIKLGQVLLVLSGNEYFFFNF